ncbi:MAG: hypothetical protein NTY44_07035 [Deltaproteobacteria bacterium]|jgi:uncharacterized integral membrane protein|nr:hypothetical protein [Deltaproteobacteria bacterium]
MPDETLERVRTMAANIASDTSLAPEQKAALVTSLSNIATPLQTDRWIYRLVVIILGLTLIFTVIGGFALVLTGQTKPMPEGLIAIGSAAVGALAGLLAPSPMSRQ